MHVGVDTVNTNLAEFADALTGLIPLKFDKLAACLLLRGGQCPYVAAV